MFTKLESRKGWLYIPGVLSAVCYALNPGIGKLALLDFNPQTVIVLKVSLAILVIFIYMVTTGKLHLLRFNRKHIPLMVMTGASLGILLIGFWQALNVMKITELMALYWCFPLIILAFDTVQDRRFYLRGTVLIAVGSFGVYIASGGHVEKLLMIEPGFVWVMVAAFFTAVYYKMGEPFREYNPATKMFWQFLIAVLLVLVMYRNFEVAVFTTTPLKGWLTLMLLVAVPQLGGYAFLLISAKKIGAVATGALDFLEPTIAVILAVMLFGESLTWLQVVGWVLISVTLIFISRLRRKFD